MYIISYMEQSTKTKKKDITPTTPKTHNTCTVKVQNEKTSIVIIESNSVCRTLTPKDISYDTLYKKGGFINNDNFYNIHTWNGLNVNGIAYDSVSIWGKLVGKSNNINKYVLPVPLNNHKLFGACVIVHSNADKILSIDSSQWNDIYESLSKTNVSNVSNVSNVLNSDEIAKKPPISKSNKRNVNVDSTGVTTTTQSVSKSTSNTSKPIVKRVKKKEAELDTIDVPVQPICELTTEKYVFTDEE